MTQYQLVKKTGMGKDRVQRLLCQGEKARRIVNVGTREARNGVPADTFMVASRVEVPANSDDKKNGLF